MNQFPVGQIIFSNHQAAGSILVQSMDNTGSKLTADPGKIPTMMEQAMDQGPLPMSPGRMNHQPGGLGQNQDILVFKDGDKKNFFRC